MGVSNDLFQLVADRYSSREEVEKYKQRAASGLLDWEKTICMRYYNKAARILDIGCGCGREAFALALYGHEVIGVDISKQEIEIARDLSQIAGHKVDFQLTNGTTLAFSSSSFDHVIIWGQVLGNVPGRENRLSILREATRVMRPQGILSLSVHNRPICEPIAIKKGLVQESSGFDLEDGDFIEKGESPSIGLCYWHYFTKVELIELLEQSGLCVVECDIAPVFGQIGWDTLLIAVAKKIRGHTSAKDNYR